MVELGRVVATAAVGRWLDADEPWRAVWLADRIRRHADDEDGEIDADDVAANDWARRNGGTVLTVWPVPDSLADEHASGRLWLITEADRSTTTALWPSDY